MYVTTYATNNVIFIVYGLNLPRSQLVDNRAN